MVFRKMFGTILHSKKGLKLAFYSLEFVVSSMLWRHLLLCVDRRRCLIFMLRQDRAHGRGLEAEDVLTLGGLGHRDDLVLCATGHDQLYGSVGSVPALGATAVDLDVVVGSLPVRKFSKKKK